MADDSSVRVALRIRPQIPREIIDMCRTCTSVTPGEPQVWLGNDKAFTFDYVFDMNTLQTDVYETCVHSLIEGCFDGFNATVLAYGQTGSGKTYTMGTGLDVTIPPEEFGIIPRAVDHLFNGIDDRQQQAAANKQQPPEFKVICQFMELYNEEVIDLFDTARDAFSRGKKSNIKIQEDVSGCISAIGLTSKIVTSKHETMQCLKLGALSRTTASTQMNVQSSRSHAVFTLHIKQQRIITCRDAESNEISEVETLTAKFHFVDLAGSERLKRTGATGERAREGISINCGLLALGNVISALGDKTKKGSHIPYRDSKLTRLLQDSLGGNSRTLMIACISPSDRDFMETLNTLKYANRARNIKNKITINQDKTSKTIASLRMEIQQLQLELMEYRQQGETNMISSTISDLNTCNVAGDGEYLGKRLVVDGVESINDMYQEITMQQTEINNLRTRVKALQETVDQLTARNAQLLTEKSLGNWITPENAASDMTQLVQGYMKEIEELRAKLLEAENNCQVLRRNASRAQSRTNLLSPRLPVCNFDQGVDADEMLSVDDVIDEAKTDVVRLKRKEKKLKQQKLCESEKDGTEEQEKDETKSDDEEVVEESDVDLSSESDSDEKENVKYEEDLAELTCEISIKQKLIEELERSQRRLHTMRQQYEDKLLQLQNKIRATQEERDKILSNFGNVGNQSEEKTKKIKEEYERKLSSLQNEMKKLQDAKKKHAQMLKNQSQHEQQLKIMRTELTEMKKTKVRLLNKMKEESARHKESETRRNREIAQLKKESRRHENQIRTLEADKKMKEVILRRKQEEVMVLRKLAKPMSDKVAGRAIRPRTALSTFEKKKTFSPKLAKLKWQTVEKEINKVILNRQSTSNFEKDMERYLEDRNKLRLKMEKVTKKRDKAILDCKSEETIKDFEDQIENIKANMDYIQGNITECQTNIMQMEEPTKDGSNDALDSGSILSGLGFEDVKYLLEKLLLFALNQGQAAAQKEVNLKEMDAKMQQVIQNNSVQQQLLHHILTQQEMDLYNFVLGEDGDENQSTESSRSSSPINSSSNSTIQGEVSSQISVNLEMTARPNYREKVRRRTATPQELLFPDSGSQGDGFISKLALSDLEDDASQELTKSARENENGRDYHNSNGIPRVPSAPGSLKMMASSNISPSPVLGRKLRYTLPETSPRAQRKSSNQHVNLPTYSRTHSLDSNHDVTPPASPTATRKSREDNVFSRLTSRTSLSSETNLDRGIIQPYTGKAKSAPLSCTHVAEGHRKAVLSVDATDDLLFSASKDRSVKIWDLHTGTEIQTLDSHPGNVMVVKYSEKTHLIFSVSLSYVKVWDIRENPIKCCKTLSSVGLISHIPSSSNASSRSSVSSKETINDIALNNSGTTLFTASGNIVRIWDMRKYLCFGKLNGGHQAAVMCLAVNDIQRDQCLVITGSKDHYIKVFEVTEGVGSIYTPRLNLDPPHYDGIESLAVKDQYLFSASRDMCIKKWDLVENEMKQSLNQAHKDWICGLKVLPSGQTLVSGCRGGYLKVWSVDTCAQLGEIKAHANSINAIATNSHSVFTASSDGTVGIWKMKEKLDHSEHIDFS